MLSWFKFFYPSQIWVWGKAVPMHTVKVCGGIEGTTPLILNLGTRGRWVFNLTSCPLYSRGKAHGTLSLGGRMAEVVIVFWRRWKFLSPAGIRTTFSRLPSPLVLSGTIFEDLGDAAQNNPGTWFQGSAAKKMRTVPFWVVTQRVVVIPYFSSWLLKMGPIGCPETSVRNYHYLLSNIPEERSS
jgi:hypothetical protein